MRLYPHQDVLAFHQKFGLIVNTAPTHLTKRKLIERVQFLQEELNEFQKACGVWSAEHESGEGPVYGTDDTDTGKQDLAGQADALVDLVYVALGTAVMLGLPWNQLWDDVQRANMAKERGTTHRGHAVDVRKPSGWEPPQTLHILAQAGYDPKHPGAEQDDH